MLPIPLFSPFPWLCRQKQTANQLLIREKAPNSFFVRGKAPNSKIRAAKRFAAVQNPANMVD
ncbi:MAG: hypothetical protein LBD02_02930 [Christensenellaceae bacterium]|jgi:hypothetical protein|nr:hypothetical protein [Christensenellaceae bacterium]